MLRVTALRFLDGFECGLADRTALVELTCEGRPGPGAGAWLDRLEGRAGLARLMPAETPEAIGLGPWIAGRGDAAGDAASHDIDWIAHLVPPPEAGAAEGGSGRRGGDGDRVLHRGAAALAALAVAIQRWARIPVARAAVIAVGPGSGSGSRAGSDTGSDAGAARIRIALPWRNRPLLRAALELARAHVDACLATQASGSGPGTEAGTGPGTGPDAAAEAAEARTRARLQAMLARARPDGLSPNALRFALAAQARDLPVTMLSGQVIQLGWGAAARQFKSSFTDRTPSLAEQLARGKPYATRRLARARLPVPAQRHVPDAAGARRAAAELGWPVVLKPAALDQGRGVHVGIDGPAALDRALADVQGMGGPGGLLVERVVPGDDHRLLVAEGRLVMATRRVPGGVTGDGRATVAELLARLNADPRRGTAKDSLLIRVEMDDEARSCLAAAGLGPDSVPAAGRVVALRRTANISTGGTAVDVSDRVHPDNARAAIRAARIVGLDLAGVDVLSPDISRSWREVGGAICEVNAQPGFRPHWLAAPHRDVNGEILDILFGLGDVAADDPSGRSAGGPASVPRRAGPASGARPGRVPVAAITGSKGKSTTAMMLHHIWCAAGWCAGVNSTVGTWVGRERIDDQNLSGMPGAALLFTDPAVEAAVLEMPRKGLIVFGQACDAYDVGALLNVQEEHIGQNGIETIDQMADLKGKVLRQARDAVVVNAADPRCLAQAARSTAPRRILVAPADPDATGNGGAGADGAGKGGAGKGGAGDAPPDLSALRAHLAAGGEAVFAAPHPDRRADGAGDWITFARGTTRRPLVALRDLPATMEGRLRFNAMNAMCAAAMAAAQGLGAAAIRDGLLSFRSDREMNPGRYNLVPGFAATVLVDYAHTPEGLSELCRLVGEMPVRGTRTMALRLLGNSGPDKVHRIAGPLIAAFDRIVVLPDMAKIRKFGYFTGPDPEAEMMDAVRGVFLEHGADPDRVTAARDHRAAAIDMLRGAGSDDLVALLIDPDEAFRIVDAARTPPAGTGADMGAGAGDGTAGA